MFITRVGNRVGELAAHTPGTRRARRPNSTARRDRSQADRYDYNTVVRFGGQIAAEKRTVRREQTRTREITRAKRSTPRDQ